MEHNISNNLSGQLEQRQHMSMRQIRSLELLALPLISLESRLTAELSMNPMLEELPPENIAEPETVKEISTEDENDYEINSIVPDEWSEELPIPSESDDSSKTDFLGFISSPPPSLRNQLISELSTMNLPEKKFHSALEIISALNDDGYLASPLADIAMLCDADLGEMEEALDIVQNIAPPGVAARDLAECLKLQLARKNLLSPKLSRLLNECLDDIENNRLSAIRKKLDISPEELEAMLKLLRTLSPAPGRQSSPAAAVIEPDMEIVRQKDGSYKTVTRQPSRSRITISPIYEKLLSDASLSDSDRLFLEEKYARAKEFISAIEMRGSTLKQIGDAIIRHQKDFLDNGIKHLSGLTMKTVAAEAGLSESTISRTVAEKFVQTPQGIFPVKFFFSAGYNSSEGKEISNQAVIEEIRCIIDDEVPAAPLSDDAIARLLKKKGINVARRTIAKYRDILKIPSSSVRKIRR